jgi:Predicted dehydrogenases and related proteins
MDRVRLAVVGAGSRGVALSKYVELFPDEGVVVSAADPNPEALGYFGDRFGLPASARFSDWRQLLERGPEYDAVIIATPDAKHVEPALAFLERKANVLLEKPMAIEEDDCRAIVAAAEKTGRIFAVCHVLLYTPYTERVKELLDAGAIGDIVSAEHLEPVGFWHQAHSFVRGNWRSSKSAAFMLLQKSCHDLDWLRHIVGGECRRVSSFGRLSHFREEHAPSGSGQRCVSCGVERDCPYSALRIYLGRYDKGERDWPLDVLARPVTREGLVSAIESGPYGRCVYRCDNDVVDHQVVILDYWNGATAAFTMTAFNEQGERRTTLFGTKGEMRLDGRKIQIYDFLRGSTRDIEVPISEDGGHAGGDFGLMRRFLAAVATGDPSLVRSNARTSLESHLIAFAAERSRLSGKVEEIRR